MSKTPCENCITLAMCKSRIEDPETLVKELAKCSIARNYITKYFDEHEGPVYSKIKLSKLKNFFGIKSLMVVERGRIKYKQITHVPSYGKKLKRYIRKVSVELKDW